MSIEKFNQLKLAIEAARTIEPWLEELDRISLDALYARKADEITPTEYTQINDLILSVRNDRMLLTGATHVETINKIRAAEGYPPLPSPTFIGQLTGPALNEWIEITATNAPPDGLPVWLWYNGFGCVGCHSARGRYSIDGIPDFVSWDKVSHYAFICSPHAKPVGKPFTKPVNAPPGKQPALPHHYAYSNEPSPRRLWDENDMRDYAASYAAAQIAESAVASLTHHADCDLLKPKNMVLSSGTYHIARICDCKSDQTAEPAYAHEYGRSNGDGSFSVEIVRGEVKPHHSPCKDWPIKPLYTRPAKTEQPPQNCREAGPGKGLCDQCAAGHYERCRYVVPAALQPEQPSLSDADIEAVWNGLGLRTKWAPYLLKFARALLAQRQEPPSLSESLEAFRDTVLHQRGALAENGMTGEQINDVLGEFDSIFAQRQDHTIAGRAEKKPYGYEDFFRDVKEKGLTIHDFVPALRKRLAEIEATSMKAALESIKGICDELLFGDSLKRAASQDQKMMVFAGSLAEIGHTADAALGAPLPNTQPATLDWVPCPVCGENHMQREIDADGKALIFCVNHGCVSNGGTMTKPLPVSVENIIQHIDRPGFAWDNLPPEEQRNLLASINELMWRVAERFSAAPAMEPKPFTYATPLTVQNCSERITAMLMECAERLGNFPEAKIDPRAWMRLLGYSKNHVNDVVNMVLPTDDDIIKFVEQYGEFRPSVWDTGIPQFHAGQPGIIKLVRTLKSDISSPSFQQRVEPWMRECFGAAWMLESYSDENSDGVRERNHRFIEESLELIQACGATAGEAHQLVDYVFGRKIGEKRQEVGGVMVTLAALCLVQKMDMHECGEIELARIWTKIEQIRAKQAAKPKHSPLP